MAVTPFKSSDNFSMAGFNEKITEADNTYVAKTGGSMTGALSMGNNKITDVANPVNDGDVANKEYVDGKSRFVKLDSIQNIDYTGVNRKYTFKGIPTMFKFVVKNVINPTQGSVDGMTLFGNLLNCFVGLAINYEFFAYITTLAGATQNVNENVALYNVSRIDSESRNQTFSLNFDSTYTMTEQKLFKSNFSNVSFDLDIYYYY